MKRIFQLCFTLVMFALGFSQGLKPIAEKVQQSRSANKTFVNYSLFTVDNSPQKKQTYEAAATGVTVMKLKQNEVERILSDKPEALEMTFPFEGKEISVELVKNYFFTKDFKVNTDKGYVNTTEGVYYHGIVKGDNESLVAISFSADGVAGVTSIKNVGNIILGKATNSTDYVSYNDMNLKAANPFMCGIEDLPENNKVSLPSYDPKVMTAKKTENCVRIYFEVGYGPYQQNGSNVQTAKNWVAAMFNNISTLYSNDGITVALSEVFVWTSVDPFTGTPNEILNKFRNTRTSFNGDLAQLLRNPATTSIAFLNTLCTTSNHSYSGVNFQYSNVPTYSWNIEAMTHEIGHNLGSPHTHACKWNGNDTAIDGCGPAGGYSEGCEAPLPTNGGTIMSYCHLTSTGINFANGFGVQPGALIRNSINSKGCLGTDCIASCPTTISGLTLNAVTGTTISATIVDNTGTNWKYKLTRGDGSTVTSGVTAVKTLNFTGLEEGKYYTVLIGSDCTGPSAYSFQQLVLTDAQWCSGALFTDPGGPDANYGDNQSVIKTFYPVNPGDKLKLTFTEFDTEAQFDFMTIYDGVNIASPRFPGGTQVSGTTIPGPFQATNAAGAITIRFISDPGETGAGWKGTFECLTLATGENQTSAGINVSKTASKGIFTITSKEKILSYVVYDASGKLVLSSDKVNNSNEKLDLAKYPAGTYVVSITTSTSTMNKKIIR